MEKIRDRIKAFKRIPAKDLQPHPLNWRTHPESQSKLMRAILEEIGYAGAVLARETKNGFQLIDGHLRVETTPDQDVPVLILDVTEEEAKQIIATYDPVSSMAEIDVPKLGELFGSINTQNEEIKSLFETLQEKGRQQGAINPIAEIVSQDDVPEPPKEAVSKTGDIWLLGNHRLMCGDSTSNDDIEKLMQGEKAELLSTDPPYMVEYTGKNRPKHNGVSSGKDWTFAYKEIDLKEAPNFFNKLFLVILNYTIDSSPIYIWHSHIQSPTLMDAFKTNNLIPHQIIIWNKPSAIFGRLFFRMKHEPCLFGWKKGFKPKHGNSKLESVWSVDWEGKSRIVGNEHPTQKPVRLFEIPIEQHITPGAIVLEPFCGSGSQIIAAEKLGRRCYAMEISPVFVDVAMRRWEQFTGKEAKKL